MKPVPTMAVLIFRMFVVLQHSTTMGNGHVQQRWCLSRHKLFFAAGDRNAVETGQRDAFTTEAEFFTSIGETRPMRCT
jgi:hypothetical protein